MASYPTLSDGRSDIIASSSAVLQLDGDLALPFTPRATAAPAPADTVLTAAAPAPDNVPELAGQPVPTFLGSDQELPAAGQTGSRKLKGWGQRRQLLQTCPPTHPCLVSVCLAAQIVRAQRAWLRCVLLCCKSSTQGSCSGSVSTYHSPANRADQPSRSAPLLPAGHSSLLLLPTAACRTHPA